MNPQDCGLKNLYQIIMRAILQENGQFTATLQFGTQIFPMPQAMKIPAAKAAVDKEWEEVEKIRRGT